MELKPCPFCGGEAEKRDGFVECKYCGASTWCFFESVEDAVEAWNKRVEAQ